MTWKKVINGDSFIKRMDMNLYINLIDVRENKKEIQETFCKKSFDIKNN
jgi:hypothetical protein